MKYLQLDVKQPTIDQYLPDEVLCERCSKYSVFYGTYYKYCGGYCSGLFGDQDCENQYLYQLTNLSNGAIAGILVGILAAVAIFIIAVVICVKTVNKRRGGMSQGSVVTPVGTSNVAVFTTPPVNPNIQTAFHCGYPVQRHPPPNMGYPMQPIAPESQTSFPPNMGYSMHPIEPLPPPYRKPE
ncbi:uncharacterized protein [Mytilus edulis]|uniref:uncharacterized protein n=1 Tax=Mytilus edulis TaxID=6550 RepID=UPI0039EE23D3